MISIILDKVRAQRPANVIEKLSPRDGVIVDVNNGVNAIVHVGALHRLANAIGGIADSNLLVVGRAFEFFAGTIDVDSKVSVVVNLYWCIGNKTNAQNDECSNKQTNNE